ncbi:IgA peptidase M64-domain-containing protein [Paraphysoderma sedebokerense]|nr:IgA peptidase M64-domain-containing protein [Paraphysoderma sedebokerense]
MNKERLEKVSKELCESFNDKQDTFSAANVDMKPMDVIKVVDNGPATNRIDIVFFGDGYLPSQRDQFFADVKRMTNDIFESVTFATLLPLMNVWAVFTPSTDEGIGTYGRAKNTAFGLYREGTELRGVYCSKPNVARSLCRGMGVGGCDFPTIIGNDEYYGGLGGEFVISTRSETSGVIVIRHEKGHNFIPVGEEYDGGQVYSGVNSAGYFSTVRSKWGQWLPTSAANSSAAPTVREEKATLRLQDYAWFELKKGEYVKKFNSDGNYKRWFMKLSLSGFPNSNDVIISIDNKPLPFKSSGILDRTFYSWFSASSGFSSGSHVISVKLNLASLQTNTSDSKGKPSNSNYDVPRQLCNIEIHEYADENEFKFGAIDDDVTVVSQSADSFVEVPKAELKRDDSADDVHYSAYPTWSSFGMKSYRPTNRRCLMRNMASDKFCHVCKEGMWLNFLSKIDLIESVSVTAGTAADGDAKSAFVASTPSSFKLSASSSASSTDYSVALSLLPLAHRRTRPLPSFSESYAISWSSVSGDGKQRQEIKEFDGKENVMWDFGKGNLEVEVRYTNQEVRVDQKGIMKSKRSVRMDGVAVLVEVIV